MNRSYRGMQNALSLINHDQQQLIQEPLLQLVNQQSKEACNLMSDISRRDLNLLLDLSNRQLASSLLLEACLFRRESRGGHFRTDAPASQPYWECHSYQRIGEGLSTRPLKL